MYIFANDNKKLRNKFRVVFDELAYHNLWDNKEIYRVKNANKKSKIWSNIQLPLIWKLITTTIASEIYAFMEMKRLTSQKENWWKRSQGKNDQFILLLYYFNKWKHFLGMLVETTKQAFTICIFHVIAIYFLKKNKTVFFFKMVTVGHIKASFGAILGGAAVCALYTVMQFSYFSVRSLSASLGAITLMTLL